MVINKISVITFVFIIAINICSRLFAGIEPQPTGELTTVVVLNFTDRGESGQWLSKALADMLITDLSQCAQLQVVERERMQILFDEMRLATTGLIEASTGAQFGKVAKVDVAIFGSFLREGENLEIEAHLINIDTEELTQVEWVRGKAADFLKLEKELSFKIIENLHVPITEAEKQSIRYLPTQSVDAVEHFYTGLNHYDKGEYYEAYAKFRGAVKKDEAYVEAMLWLGTIYSSLGKYRHAAVEFEKIITYHPEHKLANKVLFELARLYDKKLSSTKLALENYKKLIDKYPDSPHALTSQYRLARLTEMDASSSLLDIYLSYQAVSKHPIRAFGEGQHSLAGSAYYRAKNNYLELFNRFNGVPPEVEGVVVLGPESPTFYRDFMSGQREHYCMGSWGYYGRIGEGYIFKAAEGYVFKELYFEMTRTPSEKKRSGNLSYVAMMSWLSMYPEYPSKVMHTWELSIDDTDPISVNKTIDLEREVSLVEVKVHSSYSALSSWKLTAKFSPRSKEIDFDNRPRRKRPPWLGGTENGMYNTKVIQSKDGIYRLVYNNIAEGRQSYGLAGTDPDIYLVTSDDGKQWSTPINLTINSMDFDVFPSLIQDKEGMFRLSWLSGRGGRERTDMWISSSRNCLNWTKPRKVDSGLPGPPKRSFHVSKQILFQDMDGMYWIIFENADLYAIHSRDCLSWSEPVNITKANISGNKRALMAYQDTQGIYRLAWGPPSPSGTFPEVTMMTSGDGINWKREKIEIPKDENPRIYFLSLMQDNKGRHVMFFNLKGLKYSVSNDCREWSEPRDVGRYSLRAPELFQDIKGQFWLIPRERIEERCPLLTIVNSIE